MPELHDITIGSLFSGIGGLELGIERAIPGSRTVFQVEADPFARRVLAKHWPDALRINDVREATAENLPRCTILCGGFPCQDISKAGKQIGISGERSGLWREFARIIREIRPRIVIVENVAALRFRGLDAVLGDLAACGYGAVWDCVPAAAVGAPHLRDRLFVVAFAYTDLSRREKQRCAVTAPTAYQATERNSWWPPEPPIRRTCDGFPGRVDRLRCLGNAVVPQVAEVIGNVAKTFLME